MASQASGPTHRRYSHAPGNSGQSVVEFTILVPAMILLLFGLTLAAFYAFRAAAADWGVFVVGIAEGAYRFPASKEARASVTWPDIAAAISASSLGSEKRQVRASMSFHSVRSWVSGINLVEKHRGTVYFRLWRFYPGPPEGIFE